MKEGISIYIEHYISFHDSNTTRTRRLSVLLFPYDSARPPVDYFLTRRRGNGTLVIRIDKDTALPGSHQT